MIAQILSWFLFIIVVLIHLSQTPEKSVLIGKVFNNATGEPISFVNVYIANSLMGTTTNDKGEYRIERVPLGKHQLVVSMMGFETITKNVTCQDPGTWEYNFQLTPKLLIFPEIQIDAPEAKEWQKYLKRFKQEFLGRTKLASKCEIENPEVLDFIIDHKTGNFEAEAIAPLKIRNPELGYSLYGELIYFTLESDACNYLFTAKFAELDPIDEDQREYWQHNRFNVYKGSFQHFFVSLLHSRVNEEDFFISKYATRMLESDSLRSLLVSPSKYSNEFKFHFDRHITINNSAITSLRDTVLVSTAGRILEAGTIMKGYWSKLRIAHALPVEYVLEQSQFKK